MLQYPTPQCWQDMRSQWLLWLMVHPGHVKACWSNLFQPHKSSLAFSPLCYHIYAPHPSRCGPWNARSSSAVSWGSEVLAVARAPYSQTPNSHPCRRERRAFSLKDHEKLSFLFSFGGSFQKSSLSLAIWPFIVSYSGTTWPNFPSRPIVRMVAFCPATQ